MRQAELFAGLHGFGLAGASAGIHTAWTSEVDPFCRKVLAARTQSWVEHHGDIRGIDATDERVPAVEVVTAGSPCQDFSIAGMRRGLAGERSGLFAQFVRIVGELIPRGLKWAVWENVPGALTSNGGEDFASVIAALVGSDRPIHLPKHPKGRRSRYAGAVSGPWGTLAWRVLDAQHFGVAQRRKRIFAALSTASDLSIDALFGDGAGELIDAHAWRQVGADSYVLLDDDPPFDTGMAPPEPVKVRLAEILKSDVDERYYLSEKACLGILRRAAGRGRDLPWLLHFALWQQAGFPQEFAPPAFGDVARCLATGANAQRYDGESENFVVGLEVEVASTLQGGGERGYRIGAEDAAGGHLVPVAWPVALRGRENGGAAELGEPDLSNALRATQGGGDKPYVLAPVALSQNQRGEVRAAEVAPARESGGGKPGQGYPAALVATYLVHATQTPIVMDDAVMRLGAVGQIAVLPSPYYRVRRLTPTECERLQGFSDGHTDVDGASDSARYRALGNAVAVPCAAFVMRRVAEVSA
ncbi:MAG: DNA (cytosine-5-)-methyltransferase [Nitriliruptorales bacterium]